MIKHDICFGIKCFPLQESHSTEITGPRYFEQDVYTVRLSFPYGEKGFGDDLDQMLLSLSKRETNFLHDSIQPNNSKNRLNRDLQTENLHTESF